VSTDTCQAYTGTTFGEADEVPTTDGSVVFDIRKDELAPVISLTVEDSAGGGADCRASTGSARAAADLRDGRPDADDGARLAGAG